MTVMSFGRFAAAPTQATINSIARSHVGLVRIINEDRVFDCPERRVWAVADGMGGHAGGDLAAQAVIDRLRTLTTGNRELRFTDMLVALGQANGDIRQRNERFGAAAGTTVVAAIVEGRTAHIAWAGDSRAYRLRDGGLDLLTRDHSVVQELVDAGLLTPDRVDAHPQSHVVTRALGVDDDPRLQTLTVRLLPGDRLLLCSDGLSRSLSNKDADNDILERLADRLLANALARDGSDNISFALIDYRDFKSTTPHCHKAL